MGNTIANQQTQIKNTKTNQSPQTHNTSNESHLNWKKKRAKNLLDYFGFAVQRKILNDHCFILEIALLCMARNFSPFTMKGSCSLKSLKSTTLHVEILICNVINDK
jgi:hypothetical protein